MHDQIEANHDLAGALIELVALPTFLLDGDARCEVMNRHARKLVSSGLGLGLKAGRLLTDRPVDTEKLRQAIAQALERRVESTFWLARLSDSRPLNVRLAPLISDDLRLAVLVADPAVDEAIDAEALRNWYRLTKRESEIAAHLAGGSSFDEAAKDLGVTRGTAMTHLKHIYIKLGVNSHAQLVHLLSRLPRATPVSRN